MLNKRYNIVTGVKELSSGDGGVCGTSGITDSCDVHSSEVDHLGMCDVCARIEMVMCCA